MATCKMIVNQEIKEAWEALPKRDQRFLWTMIEINQIIDDPKLRFHELPSHWHRALDRADRNMLASIVTECVGRLIKNSVLPRVKKVRRTAKTKRAKSTRAKQRR